MDSNAKTNEIAFEFLPFFRAYKDGAVERFFGLDVVPASTQSHSGISSKDVRIVSENNVSGRLFMPSSIKPDQKLPILIYFHGGAFCLGSPFCAFYHNYLTSLVAEANVVALSVDYRLAPENPLPIAYEDAWDAIKWAGSHWNGHGHEDWLNEHADFQRVFIAGDSAGANISYNMAARAGVEKLVGLNLVGLCCVHPDFARKERKIHRSWTFACPTSSGWEDPRINPSVDSRLSSLGCKRVLVCVAEKDSMNDMGWFFHETLKNSEWKGETEIMETPGEDHVFHLFNPTCEKAISLLKKMASFMNQA